MLKARELLLAVSLVIIPNCLARNILVANETLPSYYILHWSHDEKQYPYLFLGKGRQGFIQNKCKYTNCYVTKNQKLYAKFTSKFDAVLFDLLNLIYISRQQLQLPRLPKQKFIFTSTETAAMFPLCRHNFDYFFNWTWTFRYLTGYDLAGNIVAPKMNKKWPRTMKPITEDLKRKLQYKSELAAWFVSNCQSKDGRRQFINRVQEALTKLGGYSVDIFGRCGRLHCPRGSSRCTRMLQRDYFFYMSFENSFASDYITEKVFTALSNYNVPVVYGGANYNIILPPGSYLNARELGPERLARKMVEITHNISAYHDFFRWRNHFSYKETTYSDDSCAICQMLNDDKQRTTTSTYDDFTRWWHEGRCHGKWKHRKGN